MENNKPTNTQIEVLMSDWLGNLRMKAEGNYTHKGKGGIKRKKNTTMREYLLGNVRGMDDLELMKQSRIAAEKIVNTVTPKPVAVQMGGNGSFQTSLPDGREVINIATDYFDDPMITSEEKCDIMLGLASHEAAHSAYTDSEISMRNIEKEHVELRQLKHAIWNIIEDERIEYHLGEDRPGLADCIGATKGYYFDRLLKKIKADGKMPTEPIPKLINTITQAIRYPSEMSREQVEENFDDLDAIRRTLTPFPMTPEECCEATDAVMDIIRKKAEEEVKKKKEQQEKEKEEEQNQQGSGEQNQQDSSQGGGQQPTTQPTEKEIRKAIADALSTKEGQKVMNAITEDGAKTNGNNSSNKLNESECKEFVNEDDSERMESGGARGAGPGNPDTFIRKPKGDPDEYQASLKKVRQFVPAMARVLTCKSQDTDYVMRSQPRGKLDTNKLVAYKAGSENIFRKSGTIICSSASVCMLIDESGSMRGQLQRAAREAAILVNEAIKRIRNVNFYCYGYTDVKLNVYSENGRTSAWALSDTGATGGTPTGDAMYLAAKRVRRFTKDPVLMLVLTDGCPNDCGLVIRQDELLRRQGFLPIGVGILTNAVENTFKEHIVMTDISQFAIEMGKLTKGKLDKMLVRTDSND